MKVPVRALAGLALIAALAGSTGSVFLSLGLGLVACPLCFYQRSFMLGALGVLVTTRLARDLVPAGAACLLVLPLVAGGLGVALFHVGLELTGRLECPDGIFGLGSAPAQSLGAFVLLATLLVPAAVAAGGARAALRTVAAVALGVLLAVASVASAPPLPEARVRPSKAEGYELQGCEPAPARHP